MRIVKLAAGICAIVALLLAVLIGDPQGPRPLGDQGDGSTVSLDLSDMLPASPTTPVLVPPQPKRSVHVDHRPPPSRLTTAEVFRPPRGPA